MDPLLVDPYCEISVARVFYFVFCVRGVGRRKVGFEEARV